jgi:hypothetical protein
LPFVHPEVCTVVESVEFVTIATTSVSSTLVVAPGIETAVLAVESTSPTGVASQGSPVVMTPLNVMICAR